MFEGLVRRLKVHNLTQEALNGLGDIDISNVSRADIDRLQNSVDKLREARTLVEAPHLQDMLDVIIWDVSVALGAAQEWYDP